MNQTPEQSLRQAQIQASSRLTTFVASNSKVLSKFIKDACVHHDMDTLFMNSETNVFDELQAARPGLIFLQASIVEKPGENIITKIKADDVLGSAYIVVFASRPEGAEFAFKVGADAFLPIPFKNEQFEQILRSIFNKPKEILAVSKHRTLLTSLEEVGSTFDFRVTWAQSAEEAIKVASERFPDLIISDYDLPQRTGAELSALLKHSHLLGHIPVIIMATSSDSSTIEDCFESGANEVFTYPFDIDKHIPTLSAIVKPPKKGKRLIALVVDDSVTVRNVISKMFKQLGYFVLMAANGQEGLDIVAQQRPDIITVDYDMPVMDGWGFCTGLRANPATASIPMIMVSSRSTLTDKRKARALGVSAYLTKPFKSEDLERIVKLVAAQSQRRQREERLEKYAGSDAAGAIKAVIYGIKEDPVPEQRFVTILSCGLCNFTQKFGWGGAEKIARALNDYLSLVIDVVVEKGGVIDSILGDEVLARFDASGDRQNDALNAVDAAVALFEQLEARNDDAAEIVRCRVGIHSDEVVLANFGNVRHRLVYSMIGEGVNTVRSLQRSAGAGGCLLSEPTYTMIADSLGELPSFYVTLKHGDQQMVYKL
jgi:CheY-like chemotaxis protein